MPRHSDLSGSNLHYSRVRVGSGNPNGVVEASIKGEVYIDESSNQSYYATAAGNNNWQPFGGGGGTSQAEYRLTFPYTAFSDQGSFYWVKTKMPIYYDKNYVDLYDDNTLIDPGDWNFNFQMGSAMGRVSDLSDTIQLSKTNLTGSKLTIVYKENFNPMVPFFYMARDDNHPVMDCKIYDYWNDGMNSGRRTSVDFDLGSWRVQSLGSPTTDYYIPTKIKLALGTDFSSNQWRLELYQLGRKKRGGGVGATNGKVPFTTQMAGPRSKGLRTVVPRAAINATNGEFDLMSLFDYRYDSNMYIMRLRDTSTNTVTQFSIQKLRFRPVWLERRDTDDVIGEVVRCDLVF